jgi:alkanesulfonate monooxygenase SsuD/methylene tetrahydromethanopterin reductase-like flavin-dependent oxidoreductase (luciferase family)
VKTGVILPSFQDTADEALAVARRADELGVDGVFCYDHLWPMGEPGRPALAPFPLLAAITASTARVAVGTLVARVGLVPDAVLLAEVDALSALAPGRVVTALGTGDRLSATENEAYGVPFAPPSERRAALRRCVRALRERGVPVWVGGGANPTVRVAEEEGVAVNLWAAAPELVALQSRRSEVTWAGPAPKSLTAVEALTGELAEAGATWAVFGWPVPLEALAGVGEQ